MKKKLLLFICITTSMNAYTQNEVVDKNLQIGTTTSVGYGKKLLFGSEGDNTDEIHFVRNNIESDKTNFILSIGDDNNDKFIIGRKFWGETEFKQQFVFQTNGYMGIGISEPTTTLDVNGTIKAQGIQSDGDFQFGPNISYGDFVKGWGHRLWFSHMDDNTDPVFMARYNTGADASEIRVSIGDCIDNRDKFSVGFTNLSGFIFSPVFVVQANGKIGINKDNPQNELDVNGTISSDNLFTSGSIGIGTTNTDGYKLAVNGIIRAKEIKVESNWADFVFQKEYYLPTLEEVEQHINTHGTLPGVPSEKEVKANGVNLAETNALLLQKIEELTLYIIEMKKEINELKQK